MSTDDTTRPFAAVLQDLARGRVHDDLSEQLAALTAAVVETGRKGTLQLTLTVALTGKGAEALTVTAATAVKPPKPEQPATLFFADQGGNLSRSDPNQPTLPLRALADPEPTPIRKEHSA